MYPLCIQLHGRTRQQRYSRLVWPLGGTCFVISYNIIYCSNMVLSGWLELRVQLCGPRLSGRWIRWGRGRCVVVKRCRDKWILLYVLYILLPLPSYSEQGVPFRAMPLIGNGDIYSYEDYAQHMSEAPFDAMMIGRYNIRRGRVWCIWIDVQTGVSFHSINIQRCIDQTMVIHWNSRSTAMGY